jgi:SAM-dependent methyltransferase
MAAADTMAAATDEQVRAYYDAAPYGSYAYLQCAPEHIAAIAHVFGLAAPPVATARVLELGCSSGGNLLPFAVRQPGARVLGLDLSGSHIERGQQAISRMGLANAELRQANLAELDPASLGRFDYIICHGLYSWVPPNVQEAMLDVCGRALAPEGVVYVSYNTYPGWKSREVIRDAMLLHSRDKANVAERLAHARAMVGFLKKVAAPQSLLSHTVDENLRILSRTGDDYLAHDYLEPYNLPCYFEQFVARAGAHGLAYLAEAEPSRMLPGNFGPQVAAALSASFADDPVKGQQYLDFAVNRTFRQSLLVDAGRAAGAARGIVRAQLGSLHFAANLPCLGGSTRLDGSEQVYGPADGSGVSSSHAAVKLAVDALTRAWPGTLSREALLAEVGAKMPDAGSPPQATLEAPIDELLAYLAQRGLVRLREQPVPLAGAPGECPRLEAGARRQLDALAPGEHTVANLWHESVDVTPAERALLPLLDGQRNHTALLHAFDNLPASVPRPAGMTLDALLSGACAKGLLA